MDQEAYVYILAGNKSENGHIPIYVGSTTDLVRRVWEHRQGIGSRHTAKYRIRKLVWYQVTESIESAKVFEHKLKRWERNWKDVLIEETNPHWQDLYHDLA